MNILVTGATGLLGRSVFRQLAANPDWQVTGTCHSRSGPGLLPLDLSEPGQIRNALEQLQPDVVIHCAAERWPDRCANQPDAAWALNVDATALLAGACEELGAQLVYISTDYVFDGTAPPYSADARPAPINFYGRSKRAGEEAVLACHGHWVLRLPLLFGPVEEPRESGVTALLETIRTREPMALDHWAIRYPTSVEEVASVLEQCLRLKAGGEILSGIYHWSGDTACTRFELAMMIADLLQLDCRHISADSAPHFVEPRPQNCQLDKARLLALGIRGGAPLPQQLASVLRPLHEEPVESG
ncbi:dTDP-4-dehydrorhamnose reductase family protein [Microbulbifer zhoushanensis]|uniref:dTDP-4-dehydrorhamnose reductase family protein n=1 Tax=Microbulbifer zhoushanensis TaxID=2904254 RepID=UPI001F48FD75|nr:SDR family oxidoreductase [Microbulbifer zhoushanensis]